MATDSVERLRASDSEYDKKLSPATYAYKQLRAIAINLTGLVGGGFAGWMIGGTLRTDAVLPSRIESLMHEMGGMAKAVAQKPARMIGGMVGTVIGGTVAGVILGYEHWVKGEALRLSTDEINRDISEAKLRMNPELVRENKYLREMIEANDVASRQVVLHGHEKPHTKVSADHSSVEPLKHGPYALHREVV